MQYAKKEYVFNNKINKHNRIPIIYTLYYTGIIIKLHTITLKCCHTK